MSTHHARTLFMLHHLRSHKKGDTHLMSSAIQTETHLLRQKQIICLHSFPINNDSLTMTTIFFVNEPLNYTFTQTWRGSLSMTRSHSTFSGFVLTPFTCLCILYDLCLNTHDQDKQHVCTRQAYFVSVVDLCVLLERPVMQVFSNYSTLIVTVSITTTVCFWIQSRVYCSSWWSGVELCSSFHLCAYKSIFHSVKKLGDLYYILVFFHSFMTVTWQGFMFYQLRHVPFSSFCCWFVCFSRLMTVVTHGKQWNIPIGTYAFSGKGVSRCNRKIILCLQNIWIFQVKKDGCW